MGLQLWNYTDLIEIQGEVPEDSIIKISNINNRLYLLSCNNFLYHGCVEKFNDSYQVCLEKEETLKLLDVASSRTCLYLVDIEGKVFKYSADLKLLNEIMLTEESKFCNHGHSLPKSLVKVQNIAVSDFGILYVTENGQLWASGHMPHIGINGEVPRKVAFFEGRVTLGISIAYDFAVVLVRKLSKSDDTDSDDYEEDVFVSTCPHCVSSTRLSSPGSQHSFSDIPLRISREKSSEEISSVSILSTESPDSEHVKKYLLANSLIPFEPETPDTSDDKFEKNSIFRTEAAREFLTRQFSWVSVGEEYLAECTEKPTRIIKENVSNMASLVYEGVKTVGDKVATLSRHVSGGSDNNENNELLETPPEIMLPETAAKDELLWSSSQGSTDKSDQSVVEKFNSIVKLGSAMINTEVWTWGNVYHGQLGTGDNVKRHRPFIISKLCNIGAVKVTSSGSHAAALTIDGRVFTWGKNESHQVTLCSNSDQSSPKVFLNSDDRIKDICCGSNNTLLLTNSLELLYIGKFKGGITDKAMKLDFLLPENMNIYTDGFKHHFLLASAQYVSLNTKHLARQSVIEDLVHEQSFLEELLLTHSTLLKPLLKKNNNSPFVNLYETFVRNYKELISFTVASTASLIDFCNGCGSETDVLVIKNAEEHLHLYKYYLNVICDLISLGGFSYISHAIDIPSQLYKLNSYIYSKKDKKSPEHIISWILMHPLQRLRTYIILVENLLRISKNTQRLQTILSKWNSFISEQESRRNEADVTRQFWENSGKLIDSLRTPERRLIRESRSHPVFLQNAGRFSSHWFILLSDLFVHVNGSSTSSHDLSTLWVEPLPDSENAQNAFSLIFPEETIVLYTTESEQKAEWLHYMQNTIKKRLNKTDTYNPPLVRRASYVFIKNPVYKDAKYNGRWLNGKMHGSGKLEWSDGRLYVGQFQNNLIHGYGRMDSPNVGFYEGYWKDGLQNGLGIMKYSTGDVYEGFFKDGVPHGHGTYKQGHFMASAASVYIGEWTGGSKNGFGVMDDIVAGEKYIGFWSDNKKHGCGLIVTSEGIYYEGVFNQDVLMGHGLMILENGSHYEGEFRAAGKFNGKGILTLSSGDRIEGTLTGSWNEDIKISSGTIRLASSSNPPKLKPESFGKLCAGADQKWKAIFRVCYQALGIPEVNSKNSHSPDTQKIWQNVAASISNSHQGTMYKNNRKRDRLSLDRLDMIPKFCLEKFCSTNCAELLQYLINAFDCPHHPLGILLSDITKAYVATYGGVRVHPLLLEHATSELNSIVRRIYEILQLLFPNLPSLGKEIYLDGNDEGAVINCSSLLHPILLPKIHSTLFILYCLHNRQEDATYWRRLMEWNKQPDCTLMSYLGVDKKFWVCRIKTNKYQEAHFSPLKDQTFTEAIETLQQLKTTFSPLEKLLVIRETFQKITKTVQMELSSEFRWTMDDLFPVFHYVVARARILHLGSEIHFIEDFMDKHLENGELGIMFTTLKACYRQTLEEKTTHTM